jgi:hypothetical protein
MGLGGDRSKHEGRACDGVEESIHGMSPRLSGFDARIVWGLSAP